MERKKIFITKYLQHCFNLKSETNLLKINLSIQLIQMNQYFLTILLLYNDESSLANKSRNKFYD